MPRSSFAKTGDVEFTDADFVSGADEAKIKVEAFIEKVADSTEIEGDVVFELSQLGMGTSTPIQTWTFAQGDDVAEMVDMVVDRAIDDGSDVGSGRVKYVLTIQGHKGRCSFSLTFPEKDDDDPDEPPTEKGLVSQQMKHNEKLVRMLTGLVEVTTRTQTTQIAQMSKDLQDYKSREVENIKVFAELYDRRTAQQIEEKKLLASEARKDEVTGMLMQGIPAVLNKLLGPKMGGPVVGEPNPVELMLRGFLSTITPDQLKALMASGLLRQDQVLGFLEIFKAVHERQSSETGPGVAAVQGEDEEDGDETPAAAKKGKKS